MFNATKVVKWLQERQTISGQKCQPIRWDEMQSWQFLDGAIVHETGKFFSIVGIGKYSEVFQGKEAQQPIILQTEIGILGFLVTNSRSRDGKLDGQPQILVQAKAELYLIQQTK